MYIPSHFEETRIEQLHGLIQAYPFGTLVTLDNGELNANHIPFELDCTASPSGMLRAHVARSNPVWRNSSSQVGALAIFQGAQAYVTPSWYATKQETGKVVPTYNYMVVHASGPIRVIDDPVWLRGLLDRLTNHFEHSQQAPWKVSDAPDDFIEKTLPAIIGIEIPIKKLLGKWKVSQNRSEADRLGVVRGLQGTGDADAIAVADAVLKTLKS
jgi:transcriptional regulator